METIKTTHNGIKANATGYVNDTIVLEAVPLVQAVMQKIGKANNEV